MRQTDDFECFKEQVLPAGTQGEPVLYMINIHPIEGVDKQMNLDNCHKYFKFMLNFCLSYSKFLCIISHSTFLSFIPQMLYFTNFVNVVSRTLAG